MSSVIISKLVLLLPGPKNSNMLAKSLEVVSALYLKLCQIKTFDTYCNIIFTRNNIFCQKKQSLKFSKVLQYDRVLCFD
jgi:hypothetical protein